MSDRGHYLIRGATVLSMAPAIGDFDNADIEIRSGEIIAVGPDLKAPGAEIIEAGNMIAIPGFVDTHWHIWGTLMRGIIGDGPEHGWFARKGRLGAHFTPEDVYAGVRLGTVEGIAAGVTTFHDWAHNIMRYEDAEENLRVHRELGTRVLFSYSAPSAHPSMPMEKMREILSKGGVPPDQVMDFANIDRIAAEVVPGSDGLLTLGIAVRGPARSEADVYRAEWGLARERDLKISMHCAGTKAEVDKIRQVEILAADGLLGDDMLLAHCLYLSPGEHALLAENGIAVSVSPLSELRLAMGFPTISEFLDAGVNVTLSLDTTAISASADVFQAMRIAVGLENSRHGDAEALTPKRALQLATLDGARALGLDHITGSLAPGKRADVVLVRTDDVNLAPVVDPYVALVHSAQPANVDTVFCDGRILKRHGEVTVADMATVSASASDALSGLMKRAGFELTTATADFA